MAVAEPTCVTVRLDPLDARVVADTLIAALAERPDPALLAAATQLCYQLHRS